MRFPFICLKNLTIVIIILLCAIVLITGCVQQNRSLPNPSQQTTSVSTPVDTDVQTTLMVTTNPKVTVTAQVVTATPQQALTYKTYSNSAYGFSIKYPSDWDVNETNPVITGLMETQIPSGFGPRFDVVEFYSPLSTSCTQNSCVRSEVHVEVDPKPFTNILEDYYVKDVAWISTNNPIEITKRDAKFSLSGQKAYRLDYRLKSSGGSVNDQLNVERAYVIIKGKAYIITFHAHGLDTGDGSQFVKYYNAIQDMFTSFNA